MGRLLLSDLVGIDPLLLAAGISILAGAAFVGAESVERRFAIAPRRVARRVSAAATGWPLRADSRVAGLLLLLSAAAGRPCTRRRSGPRDGSIEVARGIVEGVNEWTIVDVRGGGDRGGSLPHAVAVPAADLGRPESWLDRFASTGRSSCRCRRRLAHTIRAPADTSRHSAGDTPRGREEILTRPIRRRPGPRPRHRGLPRARGLSAYFTGAAAAPGRFRPPPRRRHPREGDRKPKASGGCS